MKTYKCSNCKDVMGIKCDKDIDHCPNCGMNQCLSLTDEPIPPDATLAENWKHEYIPGVYSDGCDATYSVLSNGCTEYCPNCNGQNG